MGLYSKYSKSGLVVLGAPCNQFGAQEPGSNAEIKSFAAKQGAKFPLTSKMDVNGKEASELYKYKGREGRPAEQRRQVELQQVSRGPGGQSGEPLLQHCR